MRIEDGGVFSADRFRDLLLHLEDLHARLHERGFETCDLVSNLRRLDMIADNVVEIVAHNMNDAVRKSGRNANSPIPRFLVTAAHPRDSIEESILMEARIDQFLQFGHCLGG